MIYQLPHKQTFGKDSLAYWEDFITDEEINLLLAQPEWLEMHKGRVGGSGTTLVQNEELRRSNIAWLSTKPELLEIWRKIADATADVNSRYFHLDLTGFHEPMQISAYDSKEAGNYDWHTDCSPYDRQIPRKLSMAMLLSDNSEFEGGEFEVMLGDANPRKLETKRGRAWFFPSYTLHRVTPVTKGVRRSLVLWAGGPEFK